MQAAKVIHNTRMKMERMGEEKLRGDLDMPGFRFHPTEEELVGFYLRKKAQGQKLSFEIIGTLDLYKYDPWQLPGMAFVGEKEWFFFVPCDKNCSSTRRSRLTSSGYWKATGSDRAVRNQALHCIGIKKTLVFYRGKAPRGDKTDWIMNEYRMPDFYPSIKKDVVLCRIYRKATSHKSLEQRAMADHILKGGKALEKSLESSGEGKASSMNGMMQRGFSSVNCHHDNQAMDYRSFMDDGLSSSSSAGKDPAFTTTADKESKFKLPELQVPKVSVDNIFIQSVVSPWTENTWTPSRLLSTPKDWICDGSITIPSVHTLKTISPCKVERPISFV